MKCALFVKKMSILAVLRLQVNCREREREREKERKKEREREAMLYEWTQPCLPFTDRGSPSGGPFCDMSLFPFSRCTIVEGLRVSLCESRTRTKEGKRLLPCTLIMFLPFKLFSPRAISPSLLFLLLSFFIRDIISRLRKQQRHPLPPKVVVGDFFQSRQGREEEEREN